MKKIPTILYRDPNDLRKLLGIPHKDCIWVFDGEGKATRKYDGTCVAIINGSYYKRATVKKGKEPPAGFVLVEEDNNTGKLFGWVPVDDFLSSDKYHIEAYSPPYSDGTYELVGPKIQGNPEGFKNHILIKHSEAEVFENVPRDFYGLGIFMKDLDIEGIVFHHPDGRMGKIKKKDFGMKRKEKKDA